MQQQTIQKEFYLVIDKTTDTFIGLFSNKKFVYDALCALSNNLAFNSVFEYSTKLVNYVNINKLLKRILLFESVEVVYEHEGTIHRIDIKKITPNNTQLKHI